MNKIKNGTILTYNDGTTKKLMFVDIKLQTFLNNLLIRLKLENTFKVESIRKGRLEKSLYQQVCDINFKKPVVTRAISIKGTPATAYRIQNNILRTCCLNIIKFFLKN